MALIYQLQYVYHNWHVCRVRTTGPLHAPKLFNVKLHLMRHTDQKNGARTELFFSDSRDKSRRGSKQYGCFRFGMNFFNIFVGKWDGLITKGYFTGENICWALKNIEEVTAKHFFSNPSMYIYTWNIEPWQLQVTTCIGSNQISAQQKSQWMFCSCG